MNMDKNSFSDYSLYALENLFRNYISNPDDKELSEDMIRIIESAKAFQDGTFYNNDYVAPSEAYNLIMKAISLTGDTSINDIKVNVCKEIDFEQTKNFVNNVLTVISNSRVSDNNVNMLIAWG